MEKRAKAGNAKAAGNNIQQVEVEMSEQDNVDKIRDILFGNQMRDLDRKFSQLEDRIASDFSAMRKENNSQIESLQSFVESEIDILTSKLAGEEKTRIDQLDDVDSEIKKNVRQLNDKIADLVKSLDKQSRDSNQKVLKQSQDFSSELTSQIDKTRKRMDGYNQELTLGKVDKASLAEMLNTLALQLNQEEPGTK